jgi:hypothetical protein
MNYNVEIKTTLDGEFQNYYYQHPSETNDGQPIYYGNIADRAFWFDTATDRWWNSVTAEIGDTTDTANVKWRGPVDVANLYGTYEDPYDGSSDLIASQYTLGDAWYRAETTAFESLKDFCGCEEERECYRGYLPIEGDTDDFKLVNVWMMTSGSSAEFDMVRVTGENPNWCSLRSDARIESLWETRQRAMEFAGMVKAWLRETDNMRETDNIEWCRLADIPLEPVEYITNGRTRKRYWQQTINLELIYKTENVFI